MEINYRDLRHYVAVNGHNKVLHYFDLYDSILRYFKAKPIRLLEIGIFKGESVKMWQACFPKAEITGLDIDPKCKKYRSKRINIIIGDQLDVQLIKSLGSFDIIIDDGGHLPAQVMGSFDILYPQLSAGGWYILEDMHGAYNSTVVASDRLGAHVKRNNGKDGKADFFKEILGCAVVPHMLGEYPISEMRCLNNIVAIKKRNMDLSITEGS